MSDAKLLRDKGYPHNIVQDFDSRNLVNSFLLNGSNPALLIIAEENLGIGDALLDIPDLESLLGSSPVSYEPDGVVESLSLVSRGEVKLVILDESVFDRERIYFKTSSHTSVIEIKPEDLGKVLAEMGFSSVSERPRLIRHDFGYASVGKATRHRVISGIQPSGKMHLGNYLGAVVNWKKQIAKYDENFFFLADLHSLTKLPNPADLRDRIRETVMTLIACGLDLERSVIFRQSDLGGYHTELAWLFACLTPEGRLDQMTQYKDEVKKNPAVLNGIKTYPILMSADIALYQATLVPVGEDQRQHLELCREIVRKFNNRYGYTIPVPKADVPETSARVMSLTDGTKKMSKSDENAENSCIYLLDSPDDIARKVKRAKTDSDASLRFDEDNRPEVTNLMSMFKVLSGRGDSSNADIEVYFEGKGSKGLKEELTEVLIETLRPIREKYDELSATPEEVDQVMKDAKERVEPIAKKTLATAKSRVGL
jgi:tryptophanyl-tRNA synthetase